MRIQTIIFSTLVICFLGAAVFGAEDDIEKKKSTTTALPSTTMPDTTEAPTTKPNTTTTHTTTTMTPNTTTSMKPNTTTAVSTTTVMPPTTTAPPPEPAPGRWVANDTHQNNVCIVMEAGIRMTFNYTKKDGKVVKDFILDVPKSASDGGYCGNFSDVQNLTLYFFRDWEMTFEFTNNKTSSKYYISSVKLNYSINNIHFPEAQGINGTKTVSVPVHMFDTSDKNKFVCVSNQVLYSPNATTENGLIELQTYSLTFEAFRNSHTDKFTNGVNKCKDDEVSQLVPIIVGAALGGLIIIVLIAYLIGRRRSRRGYESV